MNNVQILKMIDEGRIEELKAMVQDEIYTETLKKSKPGAAKRHSAMKKYFTYTKSAREALTKPCIVEFEGKEHVSFCNSYSLALTSESCGNIELFEDTERYPDVAKLIKYDGDVKFFKDPFTSLIADAKSKGYKLKKSEVDSPKFRYLFKYDGAYFKLGLLDSAYSIIDNGSPVEIYHKSGDSFAPMTIKNDIGMCMILPIKVVWENLGEDVIIIDMDEHAE